MIVGLPPHDSKYNEQATMLTELPELTWGVTGLGGRWASLWATKPVLPHHAFTKNNPHSM